MTSSGPTKKEFTAHDSRPSTSVASGLDPLLSAPTFPEMCPGRVALITGITGQDGSYLTELLLEKGYVVHGLVRRSSNTVRQRLDHLTQDDSIYNKRLFLHYADLDDVTTVRRILNRTQPDELYHLAGQSHVGLSFEIPESTCEFTAMGTLRLLEIVRDMEKRPRFLHASSSEIFGHPKESPQNEETPMNPVTPYGVAKAFATQMVKVYREAHGFFACNAICYNHESPRRGESFVTQKIVRSAVRIKQGNQKFIYLGNLSANKDWGYAPEYVEAMWRMLQIGAPCDFVLATGVRTSIVQFLELTFRLLDLDWKDFTKVDTRLLRPAECSLLIGDSRRAAKGICWIARKSVLQLVHEMVDVASSQLG